MEEKFIEIGGEKLKLIINFRNCYSLTKYRNKLKTGIDLSKADSDVFEELSNAVLDEKGQPDLSKLSSKTKMFIVEQNQNSNEIFTDEDIIFILQILTGKEKEELLGLLDKEVQENGYDSLTSKITNAIELVFTNAKNGQ